MTRASEIAGEMKDALSLAKVYHNMAKMYMETNNFEKAEESIEKSIEIKKKIGDSSGLAASYIIDAQLNKANARYDLAVELLLKAAEIQHYVGDKRSLVQTYQQLAHLLNEIGEHERASEFEEAAKSISDHLNTPEQDKIRQFADVLEEPSAREEV